MSKCRSCGAEIIWIKMATGKSMPCDANPIKYKECAPGTNGCQTLVTVDGRVASGLFDPDSNRFGYITHFATCPNASQHRRI